jgi:acetate kinase
VRVLVVNSGSSTLKLTLLSGEDTVLGQRALETGQRELGTPRGKAKERALEAALETALLSDLGGAQAVGHRIVHGGRRFHGAVRIDAGVRRALGELTELAPLHQPSGLRALASIGEALPELPAVACFDTAFHATMPPAAATYALPQRWRERWGVHRYGFHGLSHAWVARRAPQLLGLSTAGKHASTEPRGHRREERDDDLRIVSCHLGAGSSVCAIHGGRSLDTTMGFTPLDGLVMATRSGGLDPALVLWLLERPGIDRSGLEKTLEHGSGLLALGGSEDMRVLLERAGEDDADAGLALDVYIHRLRGGIATMAAALDGLDVLVFTGGIGQSSPAIRSMAGAGLGFLGVAIDEERNRQGAGDRDISADGALVSTLAIDAREDLEIARQVRAVLQSED